ncbi:hypothetical protein [Faecalimicrobium dakarense]|uniref:hypothetical protein n=1 Tax=Faecalimicrobium dakarense TaxID=1301100 RepID=UPI0004B498BA|nr:hypothetical protein [[Clostridium] dakarense]
MKSILIAQKSKIMPKQVIEEINKFENIVKSPYSDTYYNTSDISWTHKPEGSLRISDHWNFKSRGETHCQLDYTHEYIEGYWILGKYINGKYHVLKKFGESIDGYKFNSISKNNIELLKKLYDMGGIVKSYNWYKQYKVKPTLAKETYTKSVKNLLKYMSIDRIQRYKSTNPKVRKIIFLDDKTMETVEKLLKVYESSKELENLSKSEKGIKTLIDGYRAYEIKEVLDCEYEKFILILDNNLAIDFIF